MEARDQLKKRPPSAKDSGVDAGTRSCGYGSKLNGTLLDITPVGVVRGPAGEWAIGDGTPGPVTRRLREELLGIQYGHRPDPYGWVHKIC